jgi:hypothetical protein
MNVYLLELCHWLDPELMEKLLDCPIQTYKIESDPLLENSLFIIEPNMTPYFVNNRPDIANVKNKKLLIIHDHKSMSLFAESAVLEYREIFHQLGFEHKNIYVITQLEYDKEFIQKYWPGVNVLARDKWLMQLFERQITKFAYRFFLSSDEHEIEKNINNLEMKRFSILIRRPEKNRFEFMCELIANNIINNCNYTFVNYTPPGFTEWTQEDFQKSIPQHLEYSRPIIESWIDGIPYELKATTLTGGLFEHHDYPLSISDYFNNSKINIVFETEPNDFSFITEKTYKAMLFKKPFISVTQHHGLKALRAGGYQTFGHVIDESYDEIENYDKRVEAILKEITRLNNLPEEEFNNLINSCAPMIEHNHTHLYDEAYKYIPSEFKIKAMTSF